MNLHAISHGLRFRWINAQCFEFQFPNGVTLLTDPFFDFTAPAGSPAENMVLPEPFTAENLEGADYVFLNHNHPDHNYNLKDVCRKFHSTVLTHSATAMEVARVFDIPLTSVYPVDFNGIYYFDGFTIETFHGTHHAQKSTLESRKNSASVKDFGEDFSYIGAMGSVFNMNFMLTTDEGLRILFLGGNNDGMLERVRDKKPNLVIRNKMHSSRQCDNVAEEWSEFFITMNTQFLIPMHYETWLNTKPEFVADIFKQMNQNMEQKGLVGRVAPLERTKWYTLDLCIHTLE